jgi:hypothetical protein
MIHPDATVDECMLYIGELEREIEQLRALIRPFEHAMEKVEEQGIEIERLEQRLRGERMRNRPRRPARPGSSGPGWRALGEKT